MSSDELIPVSSAPSSPRPSSIFSCQSSDADTDSSADTFNNADDELVNRPTTFPAQPPPEADFLCRQLAPAIVLLRKLRRSLGLDPSKLVEDSTAQRVWNAIKEGNIDVAYAVDMDKYGMLAPKALNDRLQVSKAYPIRDEIPVEVELLEITEKLRMYCRDSERAQSLPKALQCSAAIVYLAFVQTLDCGGLVEERN